MKFQKGNKPPKHKENCTCLRCTRKSHNKGVKGIGFALHPENIYKPKKLTQEEKALIEYVCKGCDQIFKDYECNKRKFCSIKCKREYISLNNVGVNAFHYKGGITTSESNRKWFEKNRTKKYFHNKRREVRMEGVTGTHTLEEWETLKKLYDYMCLCCKRAEPEIALTEDHIIPISKGGSDYIHNIQPLCKSCNSRKMVQSTDFRFLNGGLV